MNKIICHFKENNWQFDLQMIKFEHSSEKSEFLENLYLLPWAWQFSNSFLKSFLIF
jgi:hypothetical protein